MDLVPRHLGHSLERALASFRVVVLHGARQCGKTTLARGLVAGRGGTYVTLDDDATRDAALADPLTFLTSRPYPLAVDEIQLGGDRLVRAVKRLVDDDPTPGRFLLTGSTNFLAVPSISESLAGRARILRLWPLSEAELAGVAPHVVGRWFDQSPDLRDDARLSRDDYLDRLCRGGYPEAIDLEPGGRRAWFESYIETVTQRDLVALADIRKVTALTRLLAWAAASTSRELNVSSAARDLGLNPSTVVSYLEWLEAVFLVHQVPAWSRNLTPRAIRRPKLHLTDSGLAADRLGAGPEALRLPTAPATGALIESFTVSEIARQASAVLDRVDLAHYRDRRDHEIDLILERRDGAIVAVEIKATASPTAGQLEHVRWLRDKVDAAAPGTFRAGVLLHTGPQAATVGDRLHLLPISTLWSASA